MKCTWTAAGLRPARGRAGIYEVGHGGWQAMTLISAIILLFLVMDPLGNIPLFLSILAQVEPKRRVRVLVRELFIALAVLVLFLFAGRYILGALHISQPSLSISGGVVLFLIALRMIFPAREGLIKEDYQEEPLVVPLAVPLIAGPSAIATVLLLVSSAPGSIWLWFVALVIAWSATAIILTLSAPLSNVLGRRGLIAMERLMGMILTTVAVQMFLTGIEKFLEMR